MNSRMVHIGEVEVTTEPMVYVCYGLGSCIGLFISDPRRTMSAAAHIPLPTTQTNHFHGADEQIDEMLQHFLNRGYRPEFLEAKVTGGSKIIHSSMNVGKQNIDAVISILRKKKVTIKQLDVGGTCSRTARYNTLS